MATERLTIEAAVDPRGIGQGFAEGVRMAERATAQMQAAASQFRMDAAQFIPEGIVPAAARAGEDAGRAIQDTIADAMAGLRNLALEIGVDARPQDIQALRDLVFEQHELAAAGDVAEVQMRQLAEAIYQLDRARVGNAATALGDAGRQRQEEIASLRERARVAVQSVDAEAAAAQRAAREEQRRAEAARQAAAGEIAARKQARSELAHDIRTLGLYGRAVDGTSSIAVSAWREEAAAIRAQAVELRLSREELLRLDTTIRRVEQSFARQQAQAQRAAVGGTALTTTTGRFTVEGRAAANAALGLGFALQSLAAGAQGADGKIRASLQGISSLGLAFGPKGMIVAGAAQAVLAVMEFTREADASAEAAKKYADQLERVRGGAVGAAGAVANLTAAQASGQRLRLAVDLNQAREEARKLRRELAAATADSRRGLMGLVDNLLRASPAESQFARLLAPAQEAFARGKLSAQEFADAIREIGETSGDPRIKEVAKTFLEQAEALLAVEVAATDAQRALGLLPGATRQPGAPLTTSLTPQIAERRALNDAWRRGGDVEREALQTAMAAFNQWRDSAAGAAAKGLSFTDALKSGDATVREHAEALLRDARALAEVGDAAKQAEERTRKAKEQFETFVRGAQDTVLRVQIAGQERGVTSDYVEAVREAQEAERRVTEEIERRGGVRAKDIRAVRELLDVQQAIRESTSIPIQLARRTPEIIPVKPVIVPGEWNTGIINMTRATEKILLGSIATFTRELEEATRDVTIAEVSPDAGVLEAAKARLAEVRAEAERAAAQMAAFALSLPPNSLLRKELEELIKRLRGSQKEANKISGTLRSFANASRGVMQIADAFGDVDDNIRRTVDGLGGMLSGIADAREALDKLKETNKDAGWADLFKKPEGLASLVTMIGGAASLIKGLFGKSDRSRMADDVVKRNNELLADLTRELRGFGNNLGTIDGTARKLGRLDMGFTTGVLKSLSFFDGDKQKRFLEDQLRSVGLSLADLNAVAKENGIQLLDEKGRLVAGAFNQLIPILDATRAKMMRWGNTFDELQQRSSAYMDLFNLEGPSAAWGEAMSVAAKLLPTEIAKQIAGFDIDSAAGRDAAQKFIQKLFTDADAGRISDDIVAAFGGIKEFTDFLLFLEQPLDDLRDAATEAAGALRNVPTGFKLDLRRFESMLAEVPRQIAQTPTPYIPPPPPTRERVAPGGTSDGGRDRVVNHFHFGDRSVVIEGMELTPDEILDGVTDAARRRAQATYGTTARAYEVIS